MMEDNESAEADLQLCVVAGKEAALGFKLAGLENTISYSKGDDPKELGGRLSAEQGVIAVTYSVYTQVEKQIEQLRVEGKLIVVVPDESGGADVLSKLVRNLVGASQVPVG